jgi:hypothetical protein
VYLGKKKRARVEKMAGGNVAHQLCVQRSMIVKQSSRPADDVAPQSDVEPVIVIAVGDLDKAAEVVVIAGEGGGDLPDWRDQIYYWTGRLELDRHLGRLVWRGNWLGSFHGKPGAEEFVAEGLSQLFEYEGDEVLEEEVWVCGILTPPPRPLRFTGYYMMDNDDSGHPERFLEKEFVMSFEERGGNVAQERFFLVRGHGESEFGPFITNGTYSAYTGVLDMARKYVISADETRCSSQI